MTRRTVLAAERAAAASPRVHIGKMPVGGPQRTASGVAALACRRACPRVTAYAAATFADRAYAALLPVCVPGLR
jgi:hypothetical protein